MIFTSSRKSVVTDEKWFRMWMDTPGECEGGRWQNVCQSPEHFKGFLEMQPLRIYLCYSRVVNSPSRLPVFCVCNERFSFETVLWSHVWLNISLNILLCEVKTETLYLWKNNLVPICCFKIFQVQISAFVNKYVNFKPHIFVLSRWETAF